ncbi:DNA polymerase III subunit delta' [Chitinimonas taiwanensis]|uniref:DNA polymerase-3 subunit delta n=1 Tax=Chitinimonas taiwanensis DSM 18899 TaxID=1121279 RepID=A0A1K2HQ56_9NEIS|nr:DNA polymerase III subunit delta' [Chitinimonas taiwanensis]SFZ78944.1 DNA polymerase-3 subunit delta' [Chitinimonas taiwanensis DSM 18899]
MLYPWQGTTWQALRAQDARQHHALLITGEPGIGKLAFARHLAKSLLCESTSDAKPCEVCAACRWVEAGNHPDYRELTPVVEDEEADSESKAKKKPSAWITIDQVRELNDFVHLSAHRGGQRVTLVQPAEALNLAAANALLKTLEEPPPGAIFILISHQWRRLLPTIRSRCRQLPMPLPERAQALAWLEAQGLADAAAHLAEAGGAPLAAIERADASALALRRALLAELAEPRQLDPLALAERLDKQKLEVGKVTDWLARWVYDLARLGLADSVRYYPDDMSRLAPLASGLDPVRLMRYHDTVLAAKKLASHPLNARLVYEQLFFAYQQAVRPMPKG